MTVTPEYLLDEERRAELWREQGRRRVAFQTELWTRSLAGDPAAAARVRGAWAAIELWNLERDEPTLDPEDDPTFDPLRISDSVNVGT